MGYFTTSMRVWHGAHPSRTQEYIQRSNQECPQSDATPKFGPSVCKNCRFPRFKRRACSKLSCAPKVYIQCVKEDVCARKARSTDGRIMKTRRIFFPSPRVLFRARLLYRQRRTEEMPADRRGLVSWCKRLDMKPLWSANRRRNTALWVLDYPGRSALLQTPLISSSGARGERVINQRARERQRADTSTAWRLWEVNSIK